MKQKYIALSLTIASCIIPATYANDLPQVDNTARNIRDRDGRNLTAQDQSNQKASIKTTAKLRREIMRTKGLSINAQNVKIIDKDGCVVLRGPVDSEQEKLTIDNLARKCCGESIVNELEIKNP
jgi:osmotically-inducible protein OsmY